MVDMFEDNVMATTLHSTVKADMNRLCVWVVLTPNCTGGGQQNLKGEEEADHGP